MYVFYAYRRICGNLSRLCVSNLGRAIALANNSLPPGIEINIPALNQHSRSYHDVVGDIVCPSQVRGIDHIRDPRLNKVSTTI